MPTVTTRAMEGAEQGAAPGPLLELADETRESSVALAPGRGGMAVRFRVRDRDVFYLDEATLRDPKKNVRGGAPVLFPSPGRLAGDAWSRAGRAGALRQHGFARELPWSVARTSVAPHASATLRLTSNDATRAAYPWDFDVELTYALEGARLAIDALVQNTGASPMPFGFGFHPYFAVRDKARARIPTTATRGFDNVSKRDVTIGTIDLTAPEVDLHLAIPPDEPAPREARLETADGGVLLRASEEYTRWVVWTLAGKDFVCLEPWTSPGDALNTGESLLTVEPGEERRLRVTIEPVI